jgi:peptidoglycan/xylan/chitin deacetylase (PgdA/CDA1 family)
MHTKKFIYLIIILLSLVGIVASLAFYSLMPKLTVSTSSVSLEVYNDYEPVSYSATNFGYDVTGKVLIDGVVDTTKVGTYPVTYSLKEGALTVKKIVTVTVKDTTSPVITLAGDADMAICSLDSYVEPGYTAMDNYDGDITSSVKVIKENNVITYTTSDSSGNIAKVTRTITETDIENPTINLTGLSTIYVPINSSFNDPGAKATDNCDGDLTSKITTSGSVNTNKVGTYEVTYNITDNHNNTNSVTRKVVVYDTQTNNDPSSNNGVIYLTFDDGPGTYTNGILDTLAKYNIKATFFVTCSGSDNTILREYQEGHTVGIHTCSHQWSIYTSSAAFFNDLNAVSNRVKIITGVEPKIMRFAGGSSNTISKHYNQGIMTELSGEVEASGYHYFDWNVSVEDAGACSKKGISNRSTCVLSYFQKYLSKNRSNYVLMHDIKSYTANALDSMIQYALSQGYTFKAIDYNTPTYHQRLNN